MEITLLECSSLIYFGKINAVTTVNGNLDF